MCDVCLYKELVELREEMRSHFTALNKKVGLIMAGVDDIETLITELNDATNVEADRFQKLLDQLKAGMTPAQVEKIKAEMRTGIDRLKTIGADPTQPIPDTTGGTGGADTTTGATGGV